MLFVNEQLQIHKNFKDLAVLVFVIRHNEILLIHKKRGLGAGLINGPGGKLEPSETFLSAAARETKEEVGLEIQSAQYMANLGFYFADGYSLYGRVFVSRQFEGNLVETDEARPFWCDIDNIPYDKMWADDRLWLPKVLGGNFTEAVFWFDKEEMTKSVVM